MISALGKYDWRIVNWSECGCGSSYCCEPGWTYEIWDVEAGVLVEKPGRYGHWDSLDNSGIVFAAGKRCMQLAAKDRQVEHDRGVRLVSGQ